MVNYEQVIPIILVLPGSESIFIDITEYTYVSLLRILVYLGSPWITIQQWVKCCTLALMNGLILML